MTTNKDEKIEKSIFDEDMEKQLEIVKLLNSLYKISYDKYYTELIIEDDQKAIALAAGIEYVSAADRLAAEQAQAEAEAEEYRKIEFKAYCEKKGLDFEKENAAYETDRAEKKANADMKASQKEAAKKAKLAAKEAAMTEEQKAAAAKKAEKKAKEEALTAVEYEKMRAAAKASRFHI